MQNSFYNPFCAYKGEDFAALVLIIIGTVFELGSHFIYMYRRLKLIPFVVFVRSSAQHTHNGIELAQQNFHIILELFFLFPCRKQTLHLFSTFSVARCSLPTFNLSLSLPGITGN